VSESSGQSAFAKVRYLLTSGKGLGNIDIGVMQRFDAVSCLWCGFVVSGLA